MMVRRRLVVRIFLVLSALTLLTVALSSLPVARWLEQLEALVAAMGPAGYVIYAAAYALCCLLLIPAIALTLGAGAIFGFVAGAIVVAVGATAGATLAFLLARGLFRHRVEGMASSNRSFRELDRALAREGMKIMWLVRLSGFPPFTWVNYAFGLTAVSFRAYLLTTAIGILPGVLAFTWAGAAGAAALAGTTNRVFLIVTAAGAVLVSAYVARIARRAMQRAGVEE